MRLRLFVSGHRVFLCQPTAAADLQLKELDAYVGARSTRSGGDGGGCCARRRHRARMAWYGVLRACGVGLACVARGMLGLPHVAAGG
jgi:hypothetical protein